MLIFDITALIPQTRFCAYYFDRLYDLKTWKDKEIFRYMPNIYNKVIKIKSKYTPEFIYQLLNSKIECANIDRYIIASAQGLPKLVKVWHQFVKQSDIIYWLSDLEYVKYAHLNNLFTYDKLFNQQLIYHILTSARNYLKQLTNLRQIDFNNYILSDECKLTVIKKMHEIYKYMIPVSYLYKITDKSVIQWYYKLYPNEFTPDIITALSNTKMLYIRKVKNE